jgi:hypothetical protein
MPLEIKKLIPKDEYPDPTRRTRVTVDQQRKSHGVKKVIRRISSKSPTASSARIPILSVLLDARENRLPARVVIQEVAESGKWFGELNEDDLAARYVNSKRRIVEIAIRYARKNLVLEGMISPPGTPAGIWEITPKGLEKLRNNEGWHAKYSIH